MSVAVNAVSLTADRRVMERHVLCNTSLMGGEKLPSQDAAPPKNCMSTASESIMLRALAKMLSKEKRGKEGGAVLVRGGPGEPDHCSERIEEMSGWMPSVCLFVDAALASLLAS